jgi:putative phosphoribosyl transferase
VIDLNEQARREMTAPVEIVIIPGATHLFEERGALESVATVARDFQVSYLGHHAQARKPARR